jgi:hypothetical protein
MPMHLDTPEEAGTEMNHGDDVAEEAGDLEDRGAKIASEVILHDSAPTYTHPTYISCRPIQPSRAIVQVYQFIRAGHGFG